MQKNVVFLFCYNYCLQVIHKFQCPLSNKNTLDAAQTASQTVSHATRLSKMTRSSLKPAPLHIGLVVIAGLLVSMAVLYTVIFEDQLRGKERDEVEDLLPCGQKDELLSSMFLEESCFADECHSSTAAADSCRAITAAGLSPGVYWIRTNTDERKFFCDTKRTCCNLTGGWTQVANLRMTDPSQSCLGEWREITSPRRTCGRHKPSTNIRDSSKEESSGWRDIASCSSAVFPVHGLNYSHVCGRLLGYQYCNTLAFWAYYHNMGATTIDDPYVDGVTITHGSPRTHIWTFAAALHEDYEGRDAVCPCTNPAYRETQRMVRVPTWVSRDYFCETGTTTTPPNSSRECTRHQSFYYSDPLWDGKGCGQDSTCCEHHHPPWFCKKLANVTSDDIEVRICGSGYTDFGDTPIELVELYVQ